MMKSLIVSLMALCLSASWNASASYLFQIHGSNTIGAKLGPALVKAYLETRGCGDVTVRSSSAFETIISCEQSSRILAVRVVSKGSSTGFEAMNKGEAHIVASSRKIKPKEVEELARFGDMVANTAEHVVAMDAVSIIVHPKNPVQTLSMLDISNLFTGSYGNWSRVGGNKEPVHVLVRDENSGTRDVFDKAVTGRGSKIYYKSQSFVSNADLSREVRKDHSSIGFVGYDPTELSKTIAIALPGGINIVPDKASIVTEDYPLSRRLYLYSPEGIDNHNAKDFMAFVGSEEAQYTVQNSGFIPISITPVVISKTGLSKRYLRVTSGYQRLSVNIRFSRSGKVIDNHGMQSIQRIAQYMENNDGSLLLVGFYGLSEGRKSRDFSAEKARVVSAALIKAGVSRSRILARGLGDRHLLTDGLSEEDNVKNIRVEVWFKPRFTSQ